MLAVKINKSLAQGVTEMLVYGLLSFYEYPLTNRSRPSQPYQHLLQNHFEVGVGCGWKLHQLKGDLTAHWAITVNGNWRVVFMFEGTDAVLVDYLDYH